MTTAQPDGRSDLYRQFARRNRRVGALRVLVPLVGIGLLAVPLVQVVISTLAQSFSFEGVRLQSDTLVVDSPRFEGTTAGGEVYAMVAERAESRVGDLDTVELYNLDLDLDGDAGYRAHVFLNRGSWTLSNEHLVSNEDVEVSDSTGARGFLAGVEVDWPGQIVTSEGPVRFEFENGSQLLAREMRYAIEDAHWRFTQVTLEMTPANDAGETRSIDDFVAAPSPADT